MDVFGMVMDAVLVLTAAAMLVFGKFGVTRELPRRLLWQTIGMGILCGWVMPGAMIQVWGTRFGVELLAVFALIPIALYSGRKLGHSKAAQWAFYLFYPVHLSVLWILRGMPV